MQNIAPSSTAVKSPPTPPPEPGPHRAAKQPSPVAKTISEESAPVNSSPASGSASKTPPIAPPPPPPLSQLTANLPTSNHSNGPIKPPPASGVPPPPPGKNEEELIKIYVNFERKKTIYDCSKPPGRRQQSSPSSSAHRHIQRAKQWSQAGEEDLPDKVKKRVEMV